MALVADTSGIIALLDRTDPAHEASVAAASDFTEIVIPALTLVEIDYWCRKQAGAATFRRFVDDIGAGCYRLEQLNEPLLQRATELEEAYSDLDLGIVDASVIATCEALDEDTILTLDRRDFAVVRPRHRQALRLLPR